MSHEPTFESESESEAEEEVTDDEAEWVTDGEEQEDVHLATDVEAGSEQDSSFC
jgi:hypothetical protein